VKYDAVPFSHVMSKRCDCDYFH